MIVCSLAFTYEIPSPERGFISEYPAKNWEHALISGNGQIGALVMSHPLSEIITFSHERLFMPIEPSLPVVNMAPHLEKIRQMMDEGRYRQATEFVSTFFLFTF